MSPGWDTKTIEEVCEIRPPKSEAKRKLKDSDLVSFAPMEDLGIDQKFLESISERKLSDVSGSYTYFADGDVLLAKITPCFENGKLGIARNLTNGVGFGSSEYIILRPRANLRSEYLYYFLLQDSFRAEGTKTMSGAVGHKRVSKEFIERCQIPLPPLPEQRRIVAILDETFAGLATATANAEKNLKNARELFGSHLNSVFTRKVEAWAEKKLHELGRLQTGTTPKTSEKGNEGNFIPFIKPGDFRADGSLDYENEGLSQKGLASSRLIPAESAAMVCIGATIGKSGYVERAVATNQQVNTITPDKGVSAKFLYYQMITSRFQNLIRSNAGQATLPIISKGKWGLLTMLLPPSVDQQLAIVARLDALSKITLDLSEVYRKKLAKIADLKQSILQKALSGELTSPPSGAIKEAAE